MPLKLLAEFGNFVLPAEGIATFGKHLRGSFYRVLSEFRAPAPAVSLITDAAYVTQHIGNADHAGAPSASSSCSSFTSAAAAE